MIETLVEWHDLLTVLACLVAFGPMWAGCECWIAWHRQRQNRRISREID